MRIKATIILFFLMLTSVWADVALLPNGVQQFFDNNGNPLTSGTVTTYEAGTNTLKGTFKDSLGTIPNTNPIKLDAGGKAIIYGEGTYRELVKDRNNNLIWDAVTAPGGGGSTPTNVGDGNLVGTILPWSGFIAPNQYVFAYGQEIARSTFPEFYTAITQQLNVICSSASNILTGLVDTTQINVGAPVEVSLCVVSGTTVVSKTSSTVTLSNPSSVSINTVATFFPFGNGNGSTTFNVPDLRGYAVAGRDNMGGSAAGRLTSSFFNSPGQGSVGGSQSHTQTISEMAAHNHGGVTGGVVGTVPNTALTFATQNATFGGAAAGVINVTTPNLPFHTHGISSQGLSLPAPIVQPTITINYIVKVTPDSPASSVSGVAAINGMTGVITCGSGLLCTGNVISNTENNSSGILYTENGSGAVLSNVNSKLQQVYTTPDDFGALGDGVLYNTNVAIISGSPTLTVSSGTFTTSDIGKYIVIPGAGAASGTLAATITGVISSTSITLGTNAGTSLSSVSTNLTYATDDTAAIQAWATKLTTEGGIGVFPRYKNYIITSEIRFQPQSNDGGSSLANVGVNPSDIWFNLNKKSVNVDFNGSRITAAAPMTNMLQFTYNTSISGTYGEFFCSVNNAVLNGASLATRGLYLNGEGQCNIKGNRIYGVTASAIKHSIYGVNLFDHNVLRAPTTFDCTDGCSDTTFDFNDMYPTLRAFFITEVAGGEIKITHNGATNELGVTSPGTTVNFVEIDATATTNTLRNISITDNLAVAGFSNFLYARGNSYNIKYITVTGNNILDYGTKADLSFINATELEAPIITGNSFNPISLTTSEIVTITNVVRLNFSNNFLTFSTNSALHLLFATGGIVNANTFYNVGNTTTHTKAIRFTNTTTQINTSNNQINSSVVATFAPNGIVEEDTSNFNFGINNNCINFTTCITLVGANSSISSGVTGTGSNVLSASPIISNPTITGSITATGLIPVSAQQQASNTVAGPVRVRYQATSVNFNSANTDTTFTLNLPSGITRFNVSRIDISHASQTLTTSTFGLFTAAAAGGVAIVTGNANTVATASENTNNNAMSVTPATANTQTYNVSQLFFRVQTAQGAAATANVSIELILVP